MTTSKRRARSYHSARVREFQDVILRGRKGVRALMAYLLSGCCADGSLSLPPDALPRAYLKHCRRLPRGECATAGRLLKPSASAVERSRRVDERGGRMQLRLL